MLLFVANLHWAMGEFAQPVTVTPYRRVRRKGRRMPRRRSK